MKLALLAIMLNEEELVDRWVEGIRRIPDVFDRMLVIDSGSMDGTVKKLEEYGIAVEVRAFEDDFSAQRNHGIEKLTDCDWIFELDADEVPSTPLLYGIREIANRAMRDGVDCIGIPRINFHDGKMQPSPGAQGLDFQYRLHRQRCRWQNPAHEEIVGWDNRVELKFAEGHFLLHLKTEARHQERNALYARILNP